MKPSTRVEAMQFSPIRKFNGLVEEVKKKGIEVIHLNIGQPDLQTPEPFFSGYPITPSEPVRYGPSLGLDSYRKALKRFYDRRGLDLDLEHIVVTTAASEAIFFVLMSICDPGDEILIPEPFYTNYRSFCDMAGITIIPVPTSWELKFNLPPIEEIESLITTRTRGFLMCTPNNPTGAVYNREVVKKLLEMGKNHDLWIINDEVYRDFVYTGDAFSMMELPGAASHGIVIDSLSKRYSACGARLGSIITKDRHLISSISKLAQARLSSPTLEQRAAAELVDRADVAIEKMKKLYEERVSTICRELDQIPDIEYIRPSGAFYVMVRLPVDDCERFTAFLLTEIAIDKKTLLVSPAAGFYIQPGRGMQEVRIAAVLDTDTLIQACRILRTGLARYCDECMNVEISM